MKNKICTVCNGKGKTLRKAWIRGFNKCYRCKGTGAIEI